ncbi:MAG: DNA translocase FtsK 4TM domain-containing protein, partial [Pseudomonadota bacterium]
MALFLGDGAKRPLMDASMSVMMRRRMNELWGLGFMICAATFFAVLWSYNVGDPSPFSATGQPALNWLGEAGAVLADTLMRYFGLGSWFFVALFGAWGIRFLLHVGEERIWARSLMG